MQIRNLIPWSRDRKIAGRRQIDGDNPMLLLQRDVNRLFDEFWSRFDQTLGSYNGFLAGGMPSADVIETDEAVEVSIELPGMDEKDIDVNVSDDVLTIRGEKKAEKDEKKKGYYLSERSFGSFHRSIALPAGVDSAKATARFKNGVLTVSLPKTPEAQEKVRRIEIKAA